MLPKVQIVEYNSEYRLAFKKLNEEWIQTYFTLEDKDREALDHPDENIISKGGFIFIALLDGEAVGVCALTKREDAVYPYELAKMAVTPKAQGHKIGWLLGLAIIEKAKSLGSKNLYLESNTKLTPAISLYEKLGFKRVAGPPTPYARCNIQMELKL